MTSEVRRVSNCGMKPQPDDVISANPRAVVSWLAWVIVAVLAAALAGAITIAVHYRGEVSALRRETRPAPAIRPAPVHPSGGVVPLTLSSGTARLAPYRSLNGEVTVFSARQTGRQAQIMVSARISGGRPDTRYDLIGADCDGSSVGAWATGTTGADGSGNLDGTAVTVSLHAYYMLYLKLPSGSPGPSLLGNFTTDGQFSAVGAAGYGAC